MQTLITTNILISSWVGKANFPNLFFQSEGECIESTNNQNETPLVKAFKNGNLEVVKYFAPKGMISEKSRSNEVTENINVKNKKCTPIRKIVFAKNQKQDLQLYKIFS